jgi:adenine/guanine/hypoxanthine permease
MAYIVVVNPGILSTKGTGLPFSGVMTATVLVAASMTLLMGLYARLPYAVAPGMGINAFFTYGIILGMNVPWPTALGMIFWAGVFFVVISVTGLRVAIARAIPTNLRAATAIGIGIFLTFIGLQGAGVVVKHPATLVTIGKLDMRALLALLGVGIAVALLKKKSPFAFLAAIFAVTLGSLPFGLAKLPEHVVSAPDFSLVGKLDVMGALKLSFVPAIASILLTDLFDSISTFIGVSQASGLVDEETGEPLRLKEGLVVDAMATLGAGLVGSSSGTAYIESSAGVEVGGRTGMTSVVTALLFLPLLFFGPLAEVVPPHATAPVLVVVGALMFRSVTIEKEHLEDALPAYLTMVLIPLTFSITQGILWGFVAHALLYTLSGRAREVKPGTWGLAGIAVALLVVERLK